MVHQYNEEYSVEENQAMALYAIANALDRLGLAGAATPMGALEVISKELKDGFEGIAGAIGSIGGAIRDAVLETELGR